ncbi:unnamed protein product, partial [Discosporangium mesarthrocarpum]
KKSGKPTTNAGAMNDLAAKGHEIAQKIIDYRFYAKVNSSFAELVHNERDIADISRQLVTLRADVPVDHKIAEFQKKTPDPDVLIPFLEEQGFKTILSKVRSEFGIDAPAAATPDTETAPGDAAYELVQDEDALKTWIAEAEAAGVVAFDTETSSLDSMQADLVGLSLSVKGGSACYVPLAHVAPGGDSDGELDLGGDAAPKAAAPKQIAFDRAIDLLKPMLEDPGVLKVGQNIKYDMQVMARYGIEVAPIDDTMVLSYVLEGGLHGHGLDELATLHLGHTNIKYSEVAGTGKKQIGFAEVALEAALDYAAEDAEVTGRIYRQLKPRIATEHMATVYETLERALIPVLSDMERRGISIDATFLKDLSGDLEKRAADIAEEIHKLAGREFNIGSPKQLGEILFDEMGIEGGKKTKTGAYGTGADVLEGLAAQGHE